MESAFPDGFDSDGVPGMGDPVRIRAHASMIRTWGRDIVDGMNKEDRETIHSLQKGARIVVSKPVSALIKLSLCAALAAWTLAIGAERARETIMLIPSWLRIIICAAIVLEMLYKAWGAFLFSRLPRLLSRIGEDTGFIRALAAMYAFEAVACVFLVMFLALGPSAPLSGFLKA